MWTTEGLDRIGSADELEMAPQRRDGTLRKLATIWVIRLDDLYIHSWRGTGGSWVRAAQATAQ